jgi:hypothetical protein
MASDVCPRRRSALLVSAHVGLLRHSVAELRTRSRGAHTSTRRRHSARSVRPHRMSRSPGESTVASLHGAGPSNTLNAATPTASVFVGLSPWPPAAVSSPPHDDLQLSTGLSPARKQQRRGAAARDDDTSSSQRVGFSQRYCDEPSRCDVESDTVSSCRMLCHGAQLHQDFVAVFVRPPKDDQELSQRASTLRMTTTTTSCCGSR